MSNFGEKMTHATVKPIEATVHGGHPFKNDKMHETLLQYLKARLQVGKQERDSRIDRMAQIDRDVAGWQRLSEDDKKRVVEKQATGKAQAITMNLPVSYVHLDDMMTYFAQTFSPNRGMFYHAGKPDETTEANQIVTLMNNHAIYTGAFREVCLAVWSMLKYNIGGFTNNWEQDRGPKLSQDSNGQDVLAEEIKWEGNRFESLDMYNTLLDPSVPIHRMHIDGEFVAMTRLRSQFWLRREASRGRYFNLSDILDGNENLPDEVYFRTPSEVAGMNNDESATGKTNYNSWFGGEEYSTGGGFELTTIYIRLNPNDFNLIEPKLRGGRSRYEVWRFTILNNERIIESQYMNNIHGYIPVFLGRLNDETMEGSTKSVAEILEPLQSFASFLLNTHVRATRKNVFGKTYYDPTVFDFSGVKEGDVVARIPMSPAGHGKDIRASIYEDTTRVDTQFTMRDLGAVMDILNQFFPTQSLPSQIASIDRAVDSQVAAVQQGSNRRNHKMARLLDDTVFRSLRFSCYYNIIQYQKADVTVTDFYGRNVKINLDALRNTDLPFIIGQGLKAVDRQAAAAALQQVIFAIIQNPQAAQQIDVLGLLDYWTSMIDIDLDMRQFHLQQQQPPGGAAADGATQVDGKVDPLTDPAAVTGPLQNRVTQ